VGALKKTAPPAWWMQFLPLMVLSVSRPLIINRGRTLAQEDGIRAKSTANPRTRKPINMNTRVEFSPLVFQSVRIASLGMIISQRFTDLCLQLLIDNPHRRRTVDQLLNDIPIEPFQVVELKSISGDPLTRCPELD